MKKVIKIYKTPTSNQINIPKAMIEETCLSDVDEVQIENKGKKIIIAKVDE